MSPIQTLATCARAVLLICYGVTIVFASREDQRVLAALMAAYFSITLWALLT